MALPVDTSFGLPVGSRYLGRWTPSCLQRLALRIVVVYKHAFGIRVASLSREANAGTLAPELSLPSNYRVGGSVARSELSASPRASDHGSIRWLWFSCGAGIGALVTLPVV